LAICGDGVRDIGEECDDGNVLSGDGCSTTCTVEDKWQCSLGAGDLPDICSCDVQYLT